MYEQIKIILNFILNFDFDHKFLTLFSYFFRNSQLYLKQSAHESEPIQIFRIYIYSSFIENSIVNKLNLKLNEFQTNQIKIHLIKI